MNLTKKLLVLLAIFCLLGSAVAVSAADADDGGWAGSQYDSVTDDGIPDGSIIEPDYNHMELGSAAGEPTGNETGDGFTDSPITDQHMEPESNSTDNSTDNSTGNATGEPVANETANANVTVVTPHNMLATGNPILALLTVGAVLGCYSILRRN